VFVSSVRWHFFVFRNSVEKLESKGTDNEHLLQTRESKKFGIKHFI